MLADWIWHREAVKFSFMYGCVGEKHSKWRAWYSPRFQASPGGLGMYPPQTLGAHGTPFSWRSVAGPAGNMQATHAHNRSFWAWCVHLLCCLNSCFNVPSGINGRNLLAVPVFSVQLLCIYLFIRSSIHSFPCWRQDSAKYRTLWGHPDVPAVHGESGGWGQDSMMTGRFSAGRF